MRCHHWAGLSRFPSASIFGAGINSRRIWLVVGGIVLFCGVVTQLNYAAHERNIAGHDDAEHWAEGVIWLVKDTEDRRSESPRIFFDTVSGLLNPSVFTAFGYERTGTFKLFQTTFPESIFAFDATEAMDALPKSDYVILTTGAKAGVYPFWESMACAEPQVQEWTQEHLIFRHRFEMYGETIDIYSKPMITLYGESGDWIMAKGAFLRLNPEEIKPGQIIELHGPDSYRRFTPASPSVSAVATIAGHEPIQIPASFHRIGEQYEIDIDPSSLRFLKDQTVDVEIGFDSFFVPKEIGMNADTRQLVVLKPTNIDIISKE